MGPTASTCGTWAKPSGRLTAAWHSVRYSRCAAGTSGCLAIGQRIGRLELVRGWLGRDVLTGRAVDPPGGPGVADEAVPGQMPDRNPQQPPLEQLGRRDAQPLANGNQEPRVQGRQVHRVRPVGVQVRHAVGQHTLAPGVLHHLAGVDVRVSDGEAVQRVQHRATEVGGELVVDELVLGRHAAERNRGRPWAPPGQAPSQLTVSHRDPTASTRVSGTVSRPSRVYSARSTWWSFSDSTRRQSSVASDPG